jgi:hypothetical protein
MLISKKHNRLISVILILPYKYGLHNKKNLIKSAEYYALESVVKPSGMT